MRLYRAEHIYEHYSYSGFKRRGNKHDFLGQSRKYENLQCIVRYYAL